MENKTGKKTFSDIFAYRAYELRKKAGYTQQQVADQIGVTVRSYLNWEKGNLKSNTSIEHLQNLADLYHVSVDYLLGNSDHYVFGSDYISNETGLSHDAIYALSLLNGNHKSDREPALIARLDIPTLNLILEYFLKAYENAEPHQKFSSVTDTLLNCIGQYIDADAVSAANLPMFKKDGVISIYSVAEIARGITSTKMQDLLSLMARQCSDDLATLKLQHKAHFEEAHKNATISP